jgi:hypothetical protein
MSRNHSKKTSWRHWGGHAVASSAPPLRNKLLRGMERLEERRLLAAELTSLMGMQDAPPDTVPGEVAAGIGIGLANAPEISPPVGRPDELPLPKLQLPEQAGNLQSRNDRIPSAPWQNAQNRFNVDNNPDGVVSPLDALLVINHISRVGSGELPVPEQAVKHFVDVDGDNRVTPLDALLIINHLRESKLELPVNLPEPALNRPELPVELPEQAMGQPERPNNLPEQDDVTDETDMPEEDVMLEEDDLAEQEGDRPERPVDLPEQALNRPQPPVDLPEQAIGRPARSDDSPEQDDLLDEDEDQDDDDVLDEDVDRPQRPVGLPEQAIDALDRLEDLSERLLDLLPEQALMQIGDRLNEGWPAPLGDLPRSSGHSDAAQWDQSLLEVSSSL